LFPKCVDNKVHCNCFLSYNGKEWANKQTNNHITHTSTQTNKTNKTNKQNKTQQSEQFQNLIEKSYKKGKIDIPYYTYT